MPANVTKLAAEEGMWLPARPVEGWSWVTLGEMLNRDDFDRLVESTARENLTPSVGFGVFDEDSAYLAAASQGGIEARLVFDDEAFDGQFEGLSPPAAMLSRGGAEAFAAWSAVSCPTAVAAAAVKRFCESPDPIELLEATGLYPKRLPDTRAAWETWMPLDFRSSGPQTWDGGGHSHLIGTREFAILAEPTSEFAGPPGPWIMLLARETRSRLTDPPVEAYLTFTTKDTVYGLRGRFETEGDAKEHFGAKYAGRTIGEWKHVPEGVGRKMAETIAWLLERTELLQNQT